MPRPGTGQAARRLRNTGLKADIATSPILRSVAQKSASFLRFLYHTHTHTQTQDRNPLNERSVCRRGRYLHNTQQTQETNIHVKSGIQTRDPRNQEAVDLRLRPLGHRDKPLTYIGWIHSLVVLSLLQNDQYLRTDYQQICWHSIRAICGSGESDEPILRKEICLTV